VHTFAGQDVVRFNQRIGGLPVLGAQLVVSLLPDLQLSSMLSTLSEWARVSPAQVSQGAAARSARAAAARSTGTRAGDLVVARAGRWVFDPAVLGAHTGLGARTVWQFEVTSGPGVRRMLLIDDRTGGVVLDVDQIQSIDRVICDAGNVPVSNQPPCTSGFARTEGGPASGVADVNAAYDLSGAVSDFYDQIGGLDLTDVLGIDVGGVRKLASTVRFCRTGVDCPYANAFWNGRQMYYGQDFAVADDVVGHEMTHGIVDEYSQLFYWGQSGAMNESLADIMGEIVDHRHASPGDNPADWRLAEDLPIGAIRNLQDPTIFGSPDRMTSALWTNDLAGGYPDGGGVHTNSGVGNKTAYLISQGGTFNGQTIIGIDGGDPSLTKTATLFLNVIQTLSSGSDYADLGRVLDQSCQSLLGAGTTGFTAVDCVEVHKAGLAPELAATPTTAAQPPDAPATCPAGSEKVVLFDSETGTPATTFTTGAAWTRNSADWGSNATSGLDSWFARDLPTTGSSTLATATGISLPAGQAAYLWFQHWRLLDYEFTSFYDGGTVEIDDIGDAAAAADISALPWVNGPSQTIVSGFGNPAGGRKGFGGDSFGFVASRVDLSTYAGRTIKPQFSMNTDNSVEFIGWWLDDITVYTCDAAPIDNATLPVISGSPLVGETLSTSDGTWTPSGLTFGYQWFRGSDPIGGAASSTYVVDDADLGAALRVQVTASRTGYTSVSALSAPTATAFGQVIAGAPTVTGSAVQGRTLTADPGVWTPADVTLTYAWLRNGGVIPGASAPTYVPGASDLGKVISVRVTGTRTGYGSAGATSAATSPVLGLLTTQRPTIGGRAKVGRKLTAKPGTWQPNGVTFTYTWLRNGAAIPGASASTYTLRNADRGSRIKVKVTGSKAGFVTASRRSAGTAKVS
jgi:hypothetical protein